MLKKVIIENNDLEEDPRKIINLFNQKNGLLIRVIRSLCDLLRKDSLKDTSQDIAKELKSYKTGINCKHDGGHFATTLILPNKPIQLFNEGIGFLYNPVGLTFKELCLSDARDDNGSIANNVVTVSNYHKFIKLIKEEKPNRDGYCTCNEAQFYLTTKSLRGAVVNINQLAESSKEQCNNIAAYLRGVAITKFLSRKFNLNLFLFIYDQKQGRLYCATRNPGIEIFKLYLKVVNQENCSILGLNATQRQELTAANKRICSQLNIIINENELSKIIENSLAASIKADIEDTINSTNENLERHYFPIQGIYLRHSTSRQAYQLIIVPTFLNEINKKRIDTMVKQLKLKLEHIHKDYYSITFADEGQLKQMNQYVYCGEDGELYKLGERAARDEQPAQVEIYR